MAESSYNIISDLSTSLLELLERANISSLLIAIEPISKKLYVLLLVYVGLRLFLGYGDIKESLSTILKIAFIATILYSAEYGFQEFIIPAIKGTRTFFEHAFHYTSSHAQQGSTDSTIYQRLDLLINKGLLIADSAFSRVSWRHSSTYLYGIWGILIIIINVILAALMTFTMLGAEVITLLLLAIGPLFVVLFIFNSTRNYFFLWISATFANIILFVICSFFISLSIDVIEKLDTQYSITDTLLASKSLEEMNNEVAKEYDIRLMKIGNPFGTFLPDTLEIKGSKEAENLKKQKENKIKEINESKKQAINNVEKEFDCDATAWFINKCSKNAAAADRIEKINSMYDEMITSTTKEYDEKINNVLNDREKRLNNLEAPLKHNVESQKIYLRLVLLFSILIKITSEIPEIARTLSGGMGAGASAAALAHQGIGMAKSAAIGAISGAAGASFGALKWAKNKISPPPPSPMQQMLEKVDTLSTQVQQQTALLERFDPRPAQPYPALTPAPQHDEAPSPKPNPAEETKPGKVKEEAHSAVPKNPQSNHELTATPPQPATPAEEGKGQETTGAETGKTVGNDSNKIDSPEKAGVNVNTHVDADVIAKGGRNSGGDGGSPNNGLPRNAAHGASGIGGAIDSAQRESAQQQSQTGSNTLPSTPATSGGSGSKGTPSASNSTTPPAPQNEKKPSITDPKGNKPPKEPPIKKL